jgi:D-aspartate ligase
MAFEIARGLPVPLLVWHAARGENAQVANEIAKARAWRRLGNERYCHKSMFDLMLALQGMSGRMSRVDVKRWRSWYSEHRAVVTDAVRDPNDRLPSVIDSALWVHHFAKHPRSFVLSYVLNR